MATSGILLNTQNNKRLFLLGGPTAVGKSTALRQLTNQLPSLGVLDADDVWRVSDDIGVEENRTIAQQNTVNAMKGYFSAGCDTGLLAWVFARELLYGPVIAGLKETVGSIQQVYLIASPQVLRQRVTERYQRQLATDKLESHIEYSLSRLTLIQALPFPKIDTSEMTAAEVTEALVRFIQPE